MTVIHWFRRDLRVGDNTALARAAEASEGAVLPVFILDDDLLKGKNVAPARVHFMLDGLRDLDAQLRRRGSRLIVRRGRAKDELLRLARESGTTAVYFNRDYTPAARSRDGDVSNTLNAAGIRVESWKDQVIFEQAELLTGQGKPYTVYAPYKKAWLARMANDEVQTTSEVKLGAFDDCYSSLDIPSARDLGFSVTQDLPQAGEARAMAVLNDFIASGRINDYQEQRNFPSELGTSHLSPYLRMGNISPRQCYAAALEAKRNLRRESQAGPDTWISELIWRDFYQQILYHFPHAKTGNFNRAYDKVVLGNGSKQRDDELFAAWCEGRTGYPIVDAAMRQMNATGWMHNRARMIVASFLSKDLLLDWRLGEAYFSRMLVDGDPAANNGGWQWASSTGTDAQPYFRIFNPKLQSERFDPDGAYIKRWVPALANVPVEFIHEPSTMPPTMQAAAGCVIGQDYPAPVVDHAAQKAEILRRFKTVNTK